MIARKRSTESERSPRASTSPMVARVISATVRTAAKVTSRSSAASSSSARVRSRSPPITATTLPHRAFTVGRPRRYMPGVDHVVVEQAGGVHQLRGHRHVEQPGLGRAGGEAEEVHHGRSHPLAPAADAEVAAGVEQGVRLPHLAGPLAQHRPRRASVASRKRAASGVVSRRASLASSNRAASGVVMVMSFTLFKTT